MSAELFDFQAVLGDTTVAARWTYTNVRGGAQIGPTFYAPTTIKRKRWRRDMSDAEVSMVALASIQPLPFYIAGNPPSNIWVVVSDLLPDGTQGPPILSAKITKVRFRFAAFVAEITAVATSRALLAELPTARFTQPCHWRFGGVECGVNVDAYRVEMASGDIVWEDGGKVLKHPSVAGKASGYYSMGYLENGFERVPLVGHDGDRVWLLHPFVAATEAVYALRPGCDKRKFTCETEFNNLPRHGGYPRIPRRNPYSSGF